MSRIWSRFGSSAILSIALAIAKHYIHSKLPSFLTILAGMRGKLLLQTSVSIKITELVDLEGAVTVRLPGVPEVPRNAKNDRIGRNAGNVKDHGVIAEGVTETVEEGLKGGEDGEEDEEENVAGSTMATECDGSLMLLEYSGSSSPVTVRRKKKSSVAPAVLLSQRLLQRRRRLEDLEEDEEDQQNRKAGAGDKTGQENQISEITKSESQPQSQANLDESLQRRKVLSELIKNRPKVL